MFFWKSFNPTTDLPDLKGKVVIVTGANTGIGYATVQHLARHGAKVYLGARSEKKAAAAIEQLKKEGLGPGNGEIVFLNLELGDPHKAKEAAEDFLKKESRLDILVNNAALLISTDYKRSFYDVQDSMMVNHIGPFVFTQTLLPLMKETAKEPDSDVRIVVLSSDALFLAPEDTRFRNKDDFNRDFKEMRVSSFRRYAMSKLANLLYVKELQKRLNNEGSPIIVTAVHPGGVNSTSNSNLENSTANDALTSSANALLKIFFSFLKTFVFTDSSVGAYTSAFAAAAPEVRASPEKYKGAYLVPVAKIKNGGKAGESEELAMELWETTERILEEAGVKV